MDDVLTTVGRGALPETVAWAGMTAPTVASATMPARIDLRRVFFMESPLKRVCAQDEPMLEHQGLTISFCAGRRFIDNPPSPKGRRFLPDSIGGLGGFPLLFPIRAGPTSPADPGHAGPGLLHKRGIPIEEFWLSLLERKRNTVYPLSRSPLKDGALRGSLVVGAQQAIRELVY